MDVGLTKIRLLSYKSQNFITHSHGSEKECFKGNEASQWKRPKFDPSPHQNQLTDLHKKWQAWIARGMRNFVAIGSGVSAPQIRDLAVHEF